MKPVLQALVLAERVYTDETGKKIIVGTFNGMELSKGPPIATTPTGEVLLRGGTNPGSPWAYISLTDVCDQTEISLQFVSLKRNQVLFGKDITIECNDRLATVEIVVPLPELTPIREPGMYAFEVVSDGEILGSHRLRVTLDGEE